MKLLIIISCQIFDIAFYDNIKILNDYIKLLDLEVDYCGISNQDDFHTYESIISFRYKMISTKQQISKMCDFITEYKSELNYDWYMKFRPDIKLLENFNFDMLSENAINARARVYYGPRKIKYGMSVNGEGMWKDIGDCFYDDEEHDIILDDMLFIFHNNMIHMGAFDKIEPLSLEIEYAQTKIFNERKIPLHVIGIYFENVKYNIFSGDINMN